MKRIYLLIYYILFQHIPMQPFPGYKLGYILRRLIVQKILIKCGKDIIVKNNCYFGNGTRLSIGNRSQLGQNARLNGKITIGEDVLMGPDVIMMSTSHAYSDLNMPINTQGEGKEKPIFIGDNVWVGTRVIILPGVSIGGHSIIGSGAVVTKSFPDYSIIGGNPAKLIKKREPINESKNNWDCPR